MACAERKNRNNPNNLLTTGVIKASKGTQVSKALTRQQSPQAGKMGVPSKVNNEATDESSKPSIDAVNLGETYVTGELKWRT